MYRLTTHGNFPFHSNLWTENRGCQKKKIKLSYLETTSQIGLLSRLEENWPRLVCRAKNSPPIVYIKHRNNRNNGTRVWKANSISVSDGITLPSFGSLHGSMEIELFFGLCFSRWEQWQQLMVAIFFLSCNVVFLFPPLEEVFFLADKALEDGNSCSLEFYFWLEIPDLLNTLKRASLESYIGRIFLLLLNFTR